MDGRVGLYRKLSAEELMLLNCGVGEGSWETLGLQGDPLWSTRLSVLGIPGKSGLPFPTPGDLPDPGIEPGSHALWTVSCVAGGFFTDSHHKSSFSLFPDRNMSRDRNLV